jgi:leucyl-tRNA synthetase
VFCLFAAPPERDLEWSDQGVEGASRFLNRLWTVIHKNLQSMKEQKTCEGNELSNLGDNAMGLLRKTHQTIKRVTNNIERNYHFNTAISALMELVNELTAFSPSTPGDTSVMRFSIERAIILLSPFAPHIAEELWKEMGKSQSLLHESWPLWDEELTKEEEIELVVQINGKLRSKLMIPAGLNDDNIKERALQDKKIAGYVKNKSIKKIIIVKGKLINIVL